MHHKGHSMTKITIFISLFYTLLKVFLNYLHSAWHCQYINCIILSLQNLFDSSCKTTFFQRNTHFITIILIYVSNDRKRVKIQSQLRQSSALIISNEKENF